WADVFVRTGTTWTQQGPSLAPASLQGNNAPRFEFSVGISHDTAVLATGQGAYVYLRTGTTWTQQTPTFGDGGVNVVPPSDNAFGASVSLTSGAMLVGD